MHVLAIDPGNEESAYALIDSETCKPVRCAKVPNDVLLAMLREGSLQPSDVRAAIEMVASYGMPVGAEVFETCVWAGKFHEAITQQNGWGVGPLLVKRLAVKMHHCHDSKAKDSNIIQALVDRFTPGAKNRGKGTKDAPGWFYGFAKDMWQAYALAVQQADELEQREAA